MQAVGNRDDDADKEINAESDDQPRRGIQNGERRPGKNDQDDPVLDHLMFPIAGLTVHAVLRMPVVTA